MHGWDMLLSYVTRVLFKFTLQELGLQICAAQKIPPSVSITCF